MRFTFKQPPSGWQPWFAWFPVPIQPYWRKRWVWLERIERKIDPVDGGMTGYQYQEIEAISNEAPEKL